MTGSAADVPSTDTPEDMAIYNCNRVRVRCAHTTTMREDGGETQQVQEPQSLCATHALSMTLVREDGRPNRDADGHGLRLAVLSTGVRDGRMCAWHGCKRYGMQWAIGTPVMPQREAGPDGV